MNLNLMNIEDMPCTSETIRRLTSLGREEMPDAMEIDEFDYKPEGDHSEVALEGGEAEEASIKDAEATLAVRDPPVDFQGGN